VSDTRPRYLIADDWTHLDVTGTAYALRWVIDRTTEALVAAQYAAGRHPEWEDVLTSAHWTDVEEHLLDANRLPEDYAAWDDLLRLSDELPAWAAAQAAR
jgi:hypothetical protein